MRHPVEQAHGAHKQDKIIKHTIPYQYNRALGPNLEKTLGLVARNKQS
jgi:hypothetical protein